MKTAVFLGVIILFLVSGQLKSQNIVAKYNFSGNVQDTSGNGYDGINHGATLISDRWGNANCAYQFDGIDDYIEVPYWNPFNFGLGDFAISVWVKTTNSTTPGMILQKGSAYSYQAPQYWLRSPDTHLNNDLAFLTSNGNPPSPYVATDTIDIADGEWHHIVAQRNEKLLELYFDCHLVSINTDVYRDINDTIGLIIGAQHPHTGNSSISNYFVGGIDDIIIFDAALTLADIQSLCSNSISINTSDEIEVSVDVVPNPFSYSTQIHVASDHFHNGELVLYDLMGQVVYKTQMESESFTLDRGSLAPGLYMLSVFQENKILSTQKVMVY